MPNIQTSKKTSLEDWHPADIVCALRKAGWSLRGLAIHHGYHPNTLMRATHAARPTPWPKGQKLIADALGVQPWEIWPSRYTADHEPVDRRYNDPRKFTPSTQCRNGSGAQGE